MSNNHSKLKNIDILIGFWLVAVIIYASTSIGIDNLNFRNFLRIIPGSAILLIVVFYSALLLRDFGLGLDYSGKSKRIIYTNKPTTKQRVSLFLFIFSKWKWKVVENMKMLLFLLPSF